MAKKGKKPKKQVASKPKPQKKASKPVKIAKPSVKAAKKAEAKTSPKTALNEVQKAGKSSAAPKAKEAKKKKKSAEDMEFDDFDGEEASLEEQKALEDFKNKSPEEIEELRALLGEAQTDEDEVEIALRDAEGRLYCKMRDCDELSVVDGYCRFHYLKLWKKIQLRKKILTDGKLEKYIEELTQRYPDKYIEMIREDLKTEKAFLSAVQELEIEDVNEDIDNEESDESLLEEVRGMQTANTDDDDSF